MSVNDGTQRFLVKIRGAAAPGTLTITGSGPGFAAENVTLASEPLFKSIEPGTSPAGSGLAPAATDGVWHLVTATGGLDTANPWEACHALVAQNPEVTFAEPDLEQQWQTGDTRQASGAMALRTGAPEPQDIGNGYAGDPNDNFWFRKTAHGQFDDALNKAADPGEGKRVRVAHLDTGFDPNHLSVPRFLRADLQRNFVDAAKPNDATDTSSGLFNNFSHGCGTLSILAGKTTSGFQGFGCAPDAEIVPVRVANRVVLFSNSSIARGLDYVHQLCVEGKTPVHVLSMSMGGIPSQAWADAVNALYEIGVVLVTAAGNNFFNVPTHLIVYPARFNRVIAACGVMANGRPYANLPLRRMAGNYGPSDKLPTSIAGYTPNTPWARFGAPAVADFDSNGTSAATPQVAAAATLWIQKHRQAYDAYPTAWMRVEAVRKALFDSAKAGAPGDADELGHGMLRAADALDEMPAEAAALVATPQDNVDLALLKLLFPGVGFAASPEQGTDAMLALEALQVATSAGIDFSSDTDREHLVGQILAHKEISSRLRQALETRGSDGNKPSVAPPPAAVDVAAAQPPGPPPTAVQMVNRLFLQLAQDPPTPPPPYRRLRIYAYDPGQQTRPDIFDVSVATVAVPWERDLKPGPVGEYLEVVDIDPASNLCYAPVDLNNPALLAQNGLAPSESDPRFHQQMAYAVAMRTIGCFERALGRRALWAKRQPRDAQGVVQRSEYVQRLRIYPHALREANAYYNPAKVALLFGYFRASASDGTVTSGSGIFAVTSHDIIAHETTHALLDGIHPRYSEATNIDMPAFHEAFADIVALFQHFSMPESLMRQIRKSAGDMGAAESLGELAQQFGEATGMHGALRRYIGEIKPLDENITEPHARGAVLVSAIFGAFMTIYRARSADLIRLATGGSGILPKGDISYDLAGRLAAEASKTADQLLNVCIRALDYCPPVNLDFGDYLRALITADRDMVADDNRGYRVAFIDAFRERAIIPANVRHLAEDSLVWEPPTLTPGQLQAFHDLVPVFDLSWNLNFERKSAFDTSEANRYRMHQWLTDPRRQEIRDILGFVEPQKSYSIQLENGSGTVLQGEIRPIEVHSVRPSRRNAPDGTSKAILTIELSQTFRAEPNQERYRGGCSLVFDLADNTLKYVVRKRLLAQGSIGAQMRANFTAIVRAAEYGQVYYAPSDAARRANAFAMIHRCGGGH
ncbi:S8 family serine peptidase [Labrys okinawensis]|uniref:S8 family serine peptidase n=1 Tax=Labrys okinawensis TaxID=346911 RepID=UPI0039BCA862